MPTLRGWGVIALIYYVKGNRLLLHSIILYVIRLYMLKGGCLFYSTHLTYVKRGDMPHLYSTLSTGGGLLKSGGFARSLSLYLREGAYPNRLYCTL